MADKRIIKDGNLSGTAGRPSLKDILKRLGPIKDMSDEEYRIFLRSEGYDEKTGKKKGGKSSGGHAPGGDLGMSIDAQVKKRREKINKEKKKSKIIDEFVGISSKTPKKNPVKKSKGGMVTKWQTKWG